MTADEAIAAYSALPPARRLQVLVAYAFDLTVIARSTYVPQTEDVADPGRLRMLNEVQHRLLAQVDGLIRGEQPRSNDAIVLTVVGGDDPELLNRFDAALRRCG